MAARQRKPNKKKSPSGGKGRGGQANRLNQPAQQPATAAKRDSLGFIEPQSFWKRWADLGLSVDTDLIALQDMLIENPLQGKLVKGTRGLRKMRFAPPSWNVGKRGATRVLYVYFQVFEVVVLLMIYSKSVQSDISSAAKKILNQEIRLTEADLKRQCPEGEG